MTKSNEKYTTGGEIEVLSNDTNIAYRTYELLQAKFIQKIPQFI